MPSHVDRPDEQSLKRVICRTCPQKADHVATPRIIGSSMIIMTGGGDEFAPRGWNLQSIGWSRPYYGVSHGRRGAELSRIDLRKAITVARI